jgi:hypothetical protein
MTPSVQRYDALNDVVIGVGGATILATLAGYGLAKFDFTGKRVVMAAVIGAIAIPGTALTVPTKNDYFGGQEVNKVFAQSAADARTGWQFLPYNSYAGTIFGDYVGKAYLGEETLADGLKNWGDALAGYGTEQGFTVSK